LFELGAGGGVRFADGIGPALELVLRVPLWLRSVAPYLRYDGALLVHDHTRDVQNAATVGIEASF
jgi:hypothetical protein